MSIAKTGKKLPPRSEEAKRNMSKGQKARQERERLSRANLEIID